MQGPPPEIVRPERFPGRAWLHVWILQDGKVVVEYEGAFGGVVESEHCQGEDGEVEDRQRGRGRGTLAHWGVVCHF